MRLFGFEVPVLVIALFSIVAALTSISDLLEIIKVKKHQNVPLVLALICFVGALFIWIVDFSFNSSKYASILGDCFTILGLGLVIGIFGFKEIPIKQTLDISHYKNMQYEIIEYDYEVMLELNKVVQQLNSLDNKLIVKSNRVHDGWALFQGYLKDYLDSSGPFIDGLHLQLLYKFFKLVGEYDEVLADGADPGFIHQGNNNIKLIIEGKETTLNIYSISGTEFETIKNKAEVCLQNWEELKTVITNRYHSRAH